MLKSHTSLAMASLSSLFLFGPLLESSASAEAVTNLKVLSGWSVFVLQPWFQTVTCEGSTGFFFFFF